MKNLRMSIFFLGLLYPFFTASQQFWDLTNEFWGGPKTGITLIDDTVLFVSTTTGILKSTNEGRRFEQVLSAPAIYTVFAASEGTLLAGGKGKVYVSEDSGASWDSISLHSEYPVKQLIENKYKALFAITGDDNNGDGVFCSEDNGKSWESRNNGLGYLRGCDKIAEDKNGRLYLALSDEESTGNGGLYISETSGLLWEKVSIQPQSMNGPAKITKTTGLSVSPGDSLYISFYGVVTNYMVQLNVCKSIDDVTMHNPWKVFHVYKASNWWEDRPLNNIHFSQNGDRYSSFTQTLNRGATYFLKAGDRNWHRIDYGLGASEDGWRHEQSFAENKSGRIFMVQYLDERIYTTDKSLVTAVNPPVKNSAPFYFYPNPVKAGGKITLQMPQSSGSGEVVLYDLTGRIIQHNFFSTGTFNVLCPRKTGIYIIVVKHQETVITEKITVN